MVVKRGGWGRITLRVPPELHQQMADIADILGLDLTGLINMMIREGLPVYRTKAAALQERSRELDELLGRFTMEMRPPDVPRGKPTIVHLPDNLGPLDIPEPGHIDIPEPAKSKKGGRK